MTILTASLGLTDAGIIAGLGYGVVFFGLILLMIVVTIVGKLFTVSAKKPAAVAAETTPVEASAAPEAPADPETTAAPEIAETSAEAIPAPETPEADSEIPSEENIPLVDGRKDYRGQTIGANYYRGFEAVGGVLSFDDAGMTFRSHALNIQTGDTRIEYKDIEHAQTRGMLTEISVRTKDGQDHRFVVFHRNDVVAFLESVKG
jgi:Na+-transporting methylmalonyl-CoA/oxaloacetate decarboxylase gamma subunit